ncbi:hypothetical protein ACGFMK_39180 [Amycolatopsis sp. NPDC049252]|uniref:Rv1733c family protein n=1 Tax=Amycolatopsis sp. NPDC049252 TaxID=3363933 RepID=UPI0037196AE9
MSILFTRLRHTLLPRRNTVARPSDRIQVALLLLLLLLSLAAAAGAILLGAGIHVVESARSVEQTASRYATTAVLLADGPSPGTVGRSGTAGEPGPARATWVTRNGRRHTGDVDAPAGTVAGNEVPVWLDATGAPAERPLTPLAAAVDATAIAAGGWAAVGFLLWLAYRCAVFVLDRFRLARWK